MKGLARVYLFSYCSLQTLLHAFLVVKTATLLLNGEYRWESVSTLAIGGTLLQLVDVVHCLIGFTKGNVTNSLVQIGGRFSMLQILRYSMETRDGFAAGLLVLVYATAEPCRYPYYAMNALGKEVYALMWIRYSAFILLYPAGLTLEAINTFLALPYYYDHYSIRLPFMTINVGVTTGLFLFLVFPFIARFLLFHMVKQRKAKLGPKDSKTK